MALTNQFDVNDSDVFEIHSSHPGFSARGGSVVVQNLGPNEVYLGSDAVTSADGFSLAANSSIPVKLGRETLHATCATGETADVRVLVSSG